MQTLILSSASPRRRQLLEQIGLSPVVCASTIEEAPKTLDPESLVLKLAEEKNRNVMEQFRAKKELKTDQFFLGADTVVVQKGEILGKPSSSRQAEVMLSLLQGQTHTVYTGVSLVRIDEDGLLPDRNAENSRLFCATTQVRFAALSAAEIHAYVETKEPLDKAGAYGIQGIFARHVEEIHGEYANVVGLPVARVYQALRSLQFSFF